MKKNRLVRAIEVVKRALGFSALIIALFYAPSLADDLQNPGNPFALISALEQRVAALEQQTTSSGMEVYDANGQYLGQYLGESYITVTGYGKTIANVFIPDLQAHVAFVAGGSNTNTADIITLILFFKEDDCQGTPYSYVNNQFDLIKNGTEYYIANTNLLPEQIAVMSRLSNGICSSYSEPTTGWFYQAMSIELPFQLPAAIPFRVE